MSMVVILRLIDNINENDCVLFIKVFCIGLKIFVLVYLFWCWRVFGGIEFVKKGTRLTCAFFAA